MIAFFCQGGLGNQLFQYAAARRLSLRHGVPLVADIDWFDHPWAEETPRAFELQHYRVCLSSASAAQHKKLWLLRSRWGRYLGPVFSPRPLRERGPGVDLRLLEAGAATYLLGYWQSERYFADIRDVLLDELQPLSPPSAEDESMISKMEACNAVSVHVRRGDYVDSASAASYHGVCSLDYYREAIEHISARVEQPEFFVFSDDPAWTRAHLGANAPMHYVSHNAPEQAFQDLRLMSLCRHHIVANSSFSWWGAWLGEPQDRLVIAPSKWFAAAVPSPDLVPSRWVRL